MHIVYMTPDFVDNMGPTTGLPKYLLRVSLALLKRGHKVSVITCSNRTVSYSFLGIRVHRVRCPNIVQYNDQRKDTLAECQRNGYLLNRALHEVYEKEKIDIVQYTSLCGLAIYHDLPVPAIMRLSSYACMWPLVGREETQATYAEIEREAAKKCDAIFAPSYVVADTFQKDTGRKVDVIETPFVMECENEDNSLYDTWLSGKKYLLFFGTLIEYKGLEVIEKAVYKILSEDSGVFLVLIGNGNLDLIDKIKTAAREFSDRILYHPAVGFQKLKPVIVGAQAVMLPSLMENFSNACVEAMALGQIVIGTDGASFEQLITDGENGFLCIPGDERSLLYAVQRAMALPKNHRTRMKRKAVERIARLAPEIVVSELLHYYTQIIKTHSVDAENKKGEEDL